MPVSTPSHQPLRPRSAALSALVAALVCGLVAASAAVLALRASIEHDWPDGARVPEYGAAHEVSVETDRPTYLWFWMGELPRSCSVVDGRSDTPLPLSRVRDHYERPGGKAYPWVAELQFVAVSPVVSVTCEGRDGMSTSVMVDAKPLLPWGLDGLPWSAWIFLLSILAAGGLLLLSALLAMRERLHRPVGARQV